MLHLENLRAGYGVTPVVAIADFRLAPGEHALILGPSGCGKTTLLYAIAGLLKPLSGNITLSDMALHEMNGAALDAFRGKQIGMIHQTLHMVPALSLMQNLLLANYAAGTAQDEAKAARLLEGLGLYDERHRRPGTLSQGQKQRAAIARAAMNSPRLILGDEPTSALDDEACDKTMQLLLDVAKLSGASLVVATHDARITQYFHHTLRLGATQ